ncbi:MAG: cytochrome P450 [Myxococcota bacterium]
MTAPATEVLRPAIPALGWGDRLRFAARLLRSGPADAFRWAHQRFGPTIRVGLPGRTLVSVTDPDDVERVTRSEFYKFGKGDIDADLVPMWGSNNVLSAHGDVWRAQRRACQPVFAPTRAPVVQEIVVRHARRLLDPLVDEAGHGPLRRELYQDLRRIVMSSCCEDWFGVTDPAEARRISDVLTRVSDVTTRLVARPVKIPRSVPTPLNLRYRARLRELDAVVAELIGRPTDRPDDLLGQMLRASGSVAPDQLRGNLVVFLVAAYETPSLGWALFLLGRHREVAERAAAEVDSVLGGADPTVADLKRLVFLDACLLEALRLHPPSPVLFREALEDVQLATGRVEAGETVAIAACALHLDPLTWPDPDSYRPERFLDRRTDGLSFLPFGTGPRACIGAAVAMQTKKTLVAMLLQRFRFAVDDGYAPVPNDPLRPHPSGSVPATLTLRPRSARDGSPNVR